MDKIRIEKNEFLMRIQKLQTKMNSNKIDYIITFGHSSEPALVRYFSDFVTAFETAGVAIPAKGEAMLLVGPENEQRAKQKNILPQAKGMKAFREASAPIYEDPSDFTFQELFNDHSKTNSLNRVGIAGWRIIPSELFKEIEEEVKKINPKAEIFSVDSLINELRMEKSESEILCIKKSSEITRLAMDYVISNIREGMTGEEIKGLAIAKMLSEGAEGEAFPMWITREEETEHAISIPTKERFKKGDLIQIQMGANYEGYSSALGRPVVIGNPSDYQKDLIHSAMSIKLATEKALEDNYGKIAETVAVIHRQEAINQGKEKMLAYGPCHSIGLVECEDPWIEYGAKFILRENMIFAVDIFISDVENHRGVRFEDTVMITKDGIERLTNYPHKLISI